MYKYTYSCMYYSYFFTYEPKINTHINVCMHKYKYSYKCNYVISSNSPLRRVVNKKSIGTSLAF